MPQTSQGTSEIVLPVAVLAALRASLDAQIGPAASAATLRRAGHQAGTALVGVLARDAGDDAPLAGVADAAFWKRLNELLAARGWGRLSHHRLHSGVGVLESRDWAEAEAPGRRTQPSCFFTTGLLAGLLGAAAGADVGVLEVACRSRGDDGCRFAFGGRAALAPLHRALADGQDLEQALIALG